MRKIFVICISILLVSCAHTDTTETELLKKRITRLEQQIDSLVSDRDINLTGSNKSSDNSVSNGNAHQVNRCQALTKKRTQCKRKAKDNNYCWQHEG